MSGWDLCFTIFSQLNKELNAIYDMKVNQQTKREKYIGIKLNHSLLRQPLISARIHTRSSFIYDIQNSGYINLNISNSNYFEITYEKKIINSSMGLCHQNQTSGECFAKCIIDNVVKQNNSYPLSYATYNSTSTYEFNDLEAEEDQFENYCKDLCSERIDCRKEFYILNKEELSYGDPDILFIKIIFSTQKTTVYEISPKIYLEENICMSLSIISLWFGFSILVITEKILISVKNTFIKLKNNFSVKNNLTVIINVSKRRRKIFNIKASNRIEPISYNPLNYRQRFQYQKHI